jgi:polysaccharide deacetylase 2 family uncharacterized protein YibQ
MPNTNKLNVVVTDAELVATVLRQVRDFNGEVTVAVQPSSSQRVPVSSPDSVAGEARHKIIQGL